MALDRSAVEVLNSCTNSEIRVEEKERVVNVCRALEEMKRKARLAGIEQGVETGTERGIERMQLLIRRMTEDGKADQLSRLSDPAFSEQMSRLYQL